MSQCPQLYLCIVYIILGYVFRIYFNENVIVSIFCVSLGHFFSSDGSRRVSVISNPTDCAITMECPNVPNDAIHISVLLHTPARMGLMLYSRVVYIILGYLLKTCWSRFLCVCSWGHLDSSDDGRATTGSRAWSINVEAPESSRRHGAQTNKPTTK